MPWQSLFCAKPSSPQSPPPAPGAGGICAHPFPTEKAICCFPDALPGSSTTSEPGWLLLGGTGHVWAWLKDTQEPLPGT